MESFYGGRPGASFIIVKTFQTIAKMKQAFQKGTGYNQVYFDEYVTIYNTSEPAYKYNGNVYRRGYDINNGLGGAQYVGNITGPAGPPTYIEPYPHGKIVRGGNITQNMSLFTNDVKDTANNNPNKYNMVEVYNGKDAFEIVPGAEKVNGTYTNFKDNIFFRYYFVMDEQNRNQIMRIGFKIPYPVFNFQVERINADEQPWIRKIDTGNHKFFHNWKVGLPIAVKGDCVTKFSVLTVQTIDGIPNNSKINYSFYSTSTEEQKAKRKSDLDNKQSILVCNIVKYNKKGQALPPETYYVYDFNIIKNIDINAQGYLIFTLPDGSQVSSGVSILPKINNFHLNEYGEMSIDWTNTDKSSGTSTLENEVKWIHDIDFDNDGGLVLTWNTKKRNNKGEIEFNTDNTPKRDSKLLTMSKGQHFITDLQIHNGILYETYAGLRKEMCDLFNESDVNNATGSGAQNIYNDAVNNPNSTLYWWNTSNRTWYKQLLDMNSIITSMFEEKVSATFPELIKYYNKGTSIDNVAANGEIKFVFSTSRPWGYSISLDIDLPEKIPTNTIFNTQKIKKDARSDNKFSGSIIRKIYLPELTEDQLAYIYQQIVDNKTAQSIWQNLGFELFDNAHPCLDPWALSFQTGSPNSQNGSDIITKWWGSSLSEQYNNQKRYAYDYRFYTGQKFYYTNFSGISHDSFFKRSCTATKAIFKGLSEIPMQYRSLYSSVITTPSNSAYFKIYNIRELYEYFQTNSVQALAEIAEKGGCPSFWCGNDSIYVWKGSSGGQIDENTYDPPNSDNLHFQIKKSLPYYAQTLFNQILTGKDFSLPEDGTIIYPPSGITATELQKQQQHMIEKIIQWNITVQDGKLHCTAGGPGGTSYDAMAGKTITVPVVVELANLNF